MMMMTLFFYIIFFFFKMSKWICDILLPPDDFSESGMVKLNLLIIICRGIIFMGFAFGFAWKIFFKVMQMGDG